MKKLILFMSLVLFGLASYSQNATTFDATLGYNATTMPFVGDAADTIGVGDSTWTYTVKKLTTNKVFVNNRVALDSLSGTPTDVYVIRRYKVFLGNPWTLLDTIATYTGTVDTTFTSQSSSAIIADYWQILVKGAGDNFNVAVDTCNFKFAY